MAITLSGVFEPAVYDVGYARSLTVTGGVPPYKLAVTAGALPTGLSVWVSSANVPMVSGIASGAPGQANFTLTLADSSGATATLATSITVPAFPEKLNIAFGEKTRGGHGGHYLGNNPGGGQLTIIAGNAAGHWAIIDNRIVPSGAFGSAPPPFQPAYALTIANNQTRSSQALTITIVKNAAHVAVGGATNPDSASNFQLRTVLAGAIANGGDTIYLRNGYYNAGSIDYRCRPSANYAGNGRITIRSEYPDASCNQYGISIKKHGAQWGRLTFDATISGDVEYPFDLVDIWFYNNQAALTGFTIVKYNGAQGWGIGSQNCRYENGPLTAQPSDCSGFTFRGSANRTYNCDDNVFYNVQHCIAHDRSVVGGVSTGSSISRNGFFNCGEDGIDFGINAVAGVICNDNIALSYLPTPTAHPDFIQSQGNTTGTNVVFGEVKRNILYSNSTANPQGLFYDDSSLSSRFTNAVIENNIIISTAPNGIYLNRFDGPSVRFNTIICALSANGMYTPAIYIKAGNGGTGGSFDYNLATAFDVSRQSGSPSITGNKIIQRTLADYQATFAAWSELNLNSADDIKRIVTPKENGNAANKDGIYAGALKPDGSWNDGKAYPKLTIGAFLLLAFTRVLAFIFSVFRPRKPK